MPNKKIQDKVFKGFLKSNDESFNKNGHNKYGYSKDFYNFFGKEFLNKYEPKMAITNMDTIKMVTKKMVMIF